MHEFPQHSQPQPAHYPVPYAPQIRTITRQYPDAGSRARDEWNMVRFGWTVQSVTVIPGKYNGGAGCCLAIIFLPLALLAGNHPDGYLVVYGTTAPPGQAILPDQVR